MGLFRRRSEQRTIGYWPGSSSNPWDPGCPMPEDRALRIGDIYACVRVLADAAASVPLIPYRRSGTGRVRLDSGRLYELLQKPSPATSQANLVAQAMAHLTLWGNAYLGKFRDQDGRLEQLAMLHPDKVTVELKGGQPLYTVTGTKGEQSKHSADDQPVVDRRDAGLLVGHELGLLVRPDPGDLGKTAGPAGRLGPLQAVQLGPVRAPGDAPRRPDRPQPDRHRAHHRTAPVSPAKNKRAARDPDATVHLQVKPGRTVVLADGCSYGDRATLQVPGRIAEDLLAAGNVEEVDPATVPDVAER
jgi:hypothetical protein